MCDNRAPAALYHCYTLLHLSLALTESFALPPAYPGQRRRPASKREGRGGNPRPPWNNNLQRPALLNLMENHFDLTLLKAQASAPAVRLPPRKKETGRGGATGLPPPD